MNPHVPRCSLARLWRAGLANEDLNFLLTNRVPRIALTRLMGFLMICIGVQFIINGLATLVQDPRAWSGLAEALRQGGG